MKEHDDGIVVHVSPENEAEVMEYFAQGDMVTLTDYREMAEEMIAYVKEHRAKLDPAAWSAADDLRHDLHYLRQVQRGEVKMVQTGFEFGAMFGVAFERLRVCLDSSAMQKHFRWKQSGNEVGQDKRETKEGKYAYIRSVIADNEDRYPSKNRMYEVLEKQYGWSRATMIRAQKK